MAAGKRGLRAHHGRVGNLPALRKGFDRFHPEHEVMVSGTARGQRQTEAAAAASSRLLRWSDRVNGWSEKLLFGLMLAMIFFTTIQVIFRVFFTAFSWTE
jgi:hypothetical protein